MKSKRNLRRMWALFALAVVIISANAAISFAASTPSKSDKSVFSLPSNPPRPKSVFSLPSNPPRPKSVFSLPSNPPRP